MEHLVEFVIPKIKENWDDVAFILGFNSKHVDNVTTQFHDDAKKCCRRILIDWLNTNQGSSPKTWSALLTNLKRLEELEATVKNIEQKLQEPSVVQKY